MQHHHRQGPTRILTALILIAGLLAVIPQAEASPVTGFDNFDSYTPGLLPGNPVTATQGTGPFYTSSGTETVGTTPAGHSGANEILHHGYLSWSEKICTTAAPDGTNRVLDFWWQIPTIPVASTILIGLGPDIGVGFSSGPSAGNPTTLHGVGIEIDNTGTITPFSDANGLGAPWPNTVIAINTWYHTSISGFRCDGTGIMVMTLNGFASSVGNGVFTSLGPFSERTTGSSYYNVFLDDVSLTGPTAHAGSLFCANIFDAGNGGSDQGGGYEYRKDTGEITGAGPGSGDSNSISFSNYWRFSGGTGSSSWDYLAKHFDPGSTAMHLTSRIEADGDGTSSVMRQAFTFDNTAVPTDTLRGDGLTTQLFSEHLETQFTETGNSWQIQAYATHTGTRTPIGGAIQYGKPNDPLLFTLWVDTGATSQVPSSFTFGATGGTFYPGPYFAITVPTGGSPANQIVGYWSLAHASGGSQTLSDALKGKSIYDQWYIGYGTTAILASVAGIDSTGSDASGNIATTDSTCIFDDAGGAVVGTGGSGVTPSSQVPTISSSSSSSSVGSFLGIDPGHMDPSGNGNLVSGGFFMSLLLIIGLASVCAGIIPGSSPKTMLFGAMLGAVLGLAWTVFMGIMPPIITFILMVVGVLVLGGRMFINGRSAGDD